MKFIDTHCHLDSSQFDQDRSEVLLRAREGGIEAMITVGSSLQSSEQAFIIAEQYKNIWASVGVHPHDAEIFSEHKDWKNIWKQQLKKLRDISSSRHVVAIGECGLDYSRGDVNRDLQKEVFKDHLRLAQEVQKPLILHIRDAHDDAIKILHNFRGVSAITHCYTGDIETAHHYVDEFGFSLSFTGIVTFGDSKIGELVDVLKNIPKDRIMIETDAPYLAPVPFRGKRCEPAYVRYIAATIARIRAEALDEVASYTTKNAIQFFHLSV